MENSTLRYFYTSSLVSSISYFSFRLFLGGWREIPKMRRERSGRGGKKERAQTLLPFSLPPCHPSAFHHRRRHHRSFFPSKKNSLSLYFFL